MQIVFLQNLNQKLPIPIKASYCDSFWPRFYGLMFRRHLNENEGLVLVDSKESRIDTAIHMLFMNFDITAVWINSRKQVVDVRLAKAWHPFYIPIAAAQFVLETHPAHLQHFHIGDMVEIINA
jgi:uncharacterized membrane protein (UPF0127 family)